MECRRSSDVVETAPASGRTRKKTNRPFRPRVHTEFDVELRVRVRPFDAAAIPSSALRVRFHSFPSSQHTTRRFSRSFHAPFRTWSVAVLVRAIFPFDPVASPTTRWIAPHVIGHVRPYLASVSLRGGSHNERYPIDGSGSVAPNRSTVQGDPPWKEKGWVPSNPKVARSRCDIETTWCDAALHKGVEMHEKESWEGWMWNRWHNARSRAKKMG